jgi:ABC-type glycerol-3-phosphate transport system substrate-binding protein
MPLDGHAIYGRVPVKKRYVAALLAAVPALGIGVAATADAATTPSVTFTRIYFDSPGSDNRSNTSLNAEYIRIHNNTSKTIQLKGWTIRDKASHVYTFTYGTLPKGTTVYVHTGHGTNGKPNWWERYWQSGNYIWNNDGDTATLKDPSKKTIDTCKYTGAGSSTNC